MISKIKIDFPNSAAAMGTRIEVDGVEQKYVRKFELSGEAGSLLTLKLMKFAEVRRIEGEADVEEIHICPQCSYQLKRVTDVTSVSDRWERRDVGNDRMVADAQVALRENAIMREALKRWGIDLEDLGIRP